MNPEMERRSYMFRDLGELPVLSPHYAYLATRIADDSELLEIASIGGRGQPTPNLLFMSVRFLLEEGADPELLANCEAHGRWIDWQAD